MILYVSEMKLLFEAFQQNFDLLKYNVIGGHIIFFYTTKSFYYYYVYAMLGWYYT